MPPIQTDHMRLALILRAHIGSGASHEHIAGDAKELILANRKLHADAGHAEAILHRIQAVMASYGSPMVVFNRDGLWLNFPRGPYLVPL